MEMDEKEKELLGRLRDGLPVAEASALLQAVEAGRVRARAPKSNPHRSSDPRVQRLSDLWFSQRETATAEQKDRVGLAYISHVLDLGDEVAVRFAHGDRSAYHQVGQRQGGVEHYTPDLEGFWVIVREAFPGMYSDAGIAFLVHEGGTGAPFHFLWQLDIPLAEESPVIRRLRINAHVYK